MKLLGVILFFFTVETVLTDPIPWPTKLKRGNSKIVGGEEAVPHSIPYQVGIVIKQWWIGDSFCGGSLIAENWVVTAAHCGILNGAKQVHLGAHEIENNNEPTQIILDGLQTIIHEDYDPATLRNDIALIRIENVTLNENIQIVPLPSSDETYAGKIAKASGWGVSQDGVGGLQPTLRFVEADVLDNVLCQRQLGAGIPIFDSIICLDGSDRKGICSGDSGGPLVDVESGVLIGITSFTSAQGCERGLPSGFTRVSSQVEWIKKIINQY